MPLLATVGNHLSQALHHLIYSFPSNASSIDHSATAPDGSSKGMASMPAVERTHARGGNDFQRALEGGVGPLSFMGSGYGIILVLMALLLNRIHHIVRRPRVPPQPQPHPPMRRLRKARMALNRFLTSPKMSKYLRIPGIIALTRAWILFTVLTLQVLNWWPLKQSWALGGPASKLLLRLGNIIGGMKMEKVCWQVFLSVCVGLICSGLASGLDRGRRRDVGAGFNLFGYSFLLHLYSSPLTHHHPPPAASQGRPDIHALLQLWLGLTELTWLQIVELSDQARHNQLLPTTVCGLFGLIHFVYALMTSPLKFPSFTFLTHLMALFLSIIIVFSVILRGLMHIFTLGYIPSPIIANLLPHQGVTPNPEDDFGVMLIKLGTACLDSTQYSGLRNELVGIEEKGPWVQLSAATSDAFMAGREGGLNTEITKIEVSELIDPHMESNYWQAVRAFGHALMWRVLDTLWAGVLRVPGGRATVGKLARVWLNRPRGLRHWRIWRRDAWRTPQHERAVEVRPLRTYSGHGAANRTARADSPPSLGLPYAELLGGPAIAEDDDEEWEDESNTSSSSSASDEEDEGTGLYRDLLTGDDGESMQPVLLAHLTSTGQTLTRRRYAAMLESPARPAPSARMEDVVAERRMEIVNRELDTVDEDRRRSCVVCTVEARDTILWPCRCLALCSECRESLAARLAAQDHLCPCCRRKVEGYSRIYVP